MSELPSELRVAYDSLSRCYGVEVAVIAHEGLLYEYRGDASRAEGLAAIAPSLAEGDGVAYRGGEKAVAVAKRGEFSIGLEGDPRALSSYLPQLARIVRGEEIRCAWCSAELDREVISCPSCGAPIPLTVGRCPKCGAHIEEVECPRCRKPITHLGTRARRSHGSLASLVIGIVLSGACTTIAAWLSAPLPLLAASAISPFIAGLVGYLR
ncbi:MAG: hypothetical protein GXO32_04730 [Crenarchaeota archaeon]|nr:hypothetical protein [Thermoproteota archaeon]